MLPLPRFVHPLLRFGSAAQHNVMLGLRWILSYVHYEILFRGRCVSVGKSFCVRRTPFVVGTRDRNRGQGLFSAMSTVSVNAVDAWLEASRPRSRYASWRGPGERQPTCVITIQFLRASQGLVKQLFVTKEDLVSRKALEHTDPGG